MRGQEPGLVRSPPESGDQIDPDFLSELPEDIRAELLQDLRMAKRSRRPPKRPAQEVQQQQQQQRVGVSHPKITLSGPSLFKAVIPPSGEAVGARKTTLPHGATLFDNSHEPRAMRADIARWFIARQGHGLQLQQYDVPDHAGSLPATVVDLSRDHLLKSNDTTDGFLGSCVVWLKSLDDRLDELSKGLGLLIRLGKRHHWAHEACEDAYKAVQLHLIAKFGFELIPNNDI